jgi:hypothetical protein
MAKIYESRYRKGFLCVDLEKDHASLVRDGEWLYYERAFRGSQAYFRNKAEIIKALKKLRKGEDSDASKKPG